MKKLLTFICLFLLTINAATAEIVVFNVKTYKIHKVSCASAKQCTVNCIKIDRSDAKARGGVPCKQCGG